MKFYILSIILLITSSSLVGQQSIPLDSISALQDTIRLGEVSVSAVRNSKMTGLLSGDITLHVEGIKSVPAITGTIDVLKVLELTPSVRTSGEGSSNIYVRGGDAGQNSLLYNGVPCYTPGHVLGLFPLFIPDHLSSLKLKKSGVSAEYGDFLSSVIEVESKRNVPAKFEAVGNAGLLASHLSLDLPLNKNWGVYLSARKTYLELLLEPMVKAVTNDDITDVGYNFWDSNFTLVGQINDDHRLLLNAMVGSDKLDIADEEISIDGFLKWRNALASATLLSDLSTNYQLEQTFSFTHFNNNLRTQQAEMYVTLNSKIEDFNYNNKLNYYIGDIPLKTGFSYTYHTVKPHNLNLVNSGVVTNSQEEDDIKAHAFSSFITTTLQPLRNLSVEPGVRYNLFSARTNISDEKKVYQSLDARLSMRYGLSPSVYLRGTYSHNNQYVHKLTPSSVGLPTDFWVAANRDIKPQRGDEFSLGYYQALFDGSWEMSADVYYRLMSNSTEFDYNFLENDNSSFTEKMKYGIGRAYGLEIMLKKNFGKLTGWVGYSLGKSDRKFEGLNGGERFRARFDRTHDLTTTFNYKFNDKWDASLTYVYATGNTYTQPTSWYFINNMPVKEYTKHNNARLPNYSRADLGVNYWFSPNNGLNISLYNMFAEENPIYVFMVVKRSIDDYYQIDMKRKKLFTLIPSVSWNFKF